MLTRFPASDFQLTRLQPTWCTDTVIAQLKQYLLDRTFFLQILFWT